MFLYSSNRVLDTYLYVKIIIHRIGYVFPCVLSIRLFDSGIGTGIEGKSSVAICIIMRHRYFI